MSKYVKNKIVALLLTGVVVVSCLLMNVLAGGLPPEEGALGDVSWYVEEKQGEIFYFTHGTIVYGHEFGFRRYPNNCNSDIVWLVFSSSNKEVKDFQGEQVTVELNLHNELIEIELDFLFTGVIGLTHVMYFSNWLAGEELINALAKSKNVKVKIVEPKGLEKLMDIQPDTFDLGGFNESRKKVEETCRKKFKYRKDNHQPEKFNNLKKLGKLPK